MFHDKPATRAGAHDLNHGNLQRADILLSRGEGLVSDLIAKSDGGKYSHGALWSGSHIIQATSAGITRTPLAGEHDVYRRIGLTSEGAEAVVAVADAEVGGRYAYGELVLLGLLFMSGAKVRGAWASRMLDALGGPTAKNLREWLDKNSGSKVRVCTELVASCFYRANNHQFAIRVLPASARPRPASEDFLEGLPPLGTDEDELARDGAHDPLDGELAALRRSCAVLLAQPAQGADSDDASRDLIGAAIAFSTSGESVGVVTPADLQFSPSLEFVGRIRA
jgi:hypothetical protein